MKNLFLSLGVIAVVISTLLSMFIRPFLVLADCPNCYANALPLNTTKNYDGSNKKGWDGRPLVSWRIDGSWDTRQLDGQGKSVVRTHPDIWNAANKAFDSWENSTGVKGEKLEIDFHIEQKWPQATITIVKLNVLPFPHEHACAVTIPLGEGRYQIAFTEKATKYDFNFLLNTMMHEIGHTLGLAHPTRMDRLNGCETKIKTVMKQEPSKGCGKFVPGEAPLSPINISKANAVQKRKADCLYYINDPFAQNQGGESSPSQVPTPTDCVDFDRDSYCDWEDCNDYDSSINVVCPCTDEDWDNVCSNEDCDDSDPNIISDEDGDGYCQGSNTEHEQFDCDDNDSSINPGAAEESRYDNDIDCSLCRDEKDNDCDGRTDRNDGKCRRCHD
jgi:hypothetical protein